MKKIKIILFAILISLPLTVLNYNTASLSVYAENKDLFITFIKNGKTSIIRADEINKYCDYPLAVKLVKIISRNRELILERPCFNPEIDVTDKENMLKEGKTILNQTTYLRQAGINPETMKLNSSTEADENDTINKILESSFMVYYTSLVDIDSDGENEIRFHSVQGKLYEEDNYFFKKDHDGRYKLIECGLGGEEYLMFIKYKNKIYTALRNKEEKINRIKIYSFNAVSKTFDFLFTIDFKNKKVNNKKSKNIILSLDEDI